MKHFHYSEIDEKKVDVYGSTGTTIRVFISEEEAPNFIMRRFEIKPLGQIGVHSHDWEHEIFILQGNVVLINDDVLNVNFKDLPCFNKIVSNLPFQISSPVTFKILDYDFDIAFLIYQKEFADRMIAKPNSKNYSRLSVGVYYKAFCEVIRYVPKTCFNPQPKVDSCIVKLVPKKSPPFNITNEEFFFDLTKKLFNHRRKKIRYTIKNEFSIDDSCIPFLDERVETLSPEDIGNLSDIIYKKICL